MRKLGVNSFRRRKERNRQNQQGFLGFFLLALSSGDQQLRRPGEKKKIRYTILNAITGVSAGGKEKIRKGDSRKCGAQRGSNSRKTLCSKDF